jgi:hypothetical protein
MTTPAAGARIHWAHRRHQSPPSRHAVKLHTPKRTRISLLYVLNAGAGTLRSENGRLTLTLTGVEPQTVWFSDRPARRTGSFPARDMVSSWEGFGFGRVPPNAALVYTDEERRDRTVILELSQPYVERGGHVMSFPVTVVDPRTVRSGDLAGHAKVADRRPASHLVDPSLFIDSVSGVSSGGCVLQPYSDCSGWGLGLYGTDFNELDLQGMDFEGDDLGNSTFTGANLNGANLAKTNVEGDSFNDVQASNASFEEADMNWSNFTGANLTKATVGTYAEDANFDNANLTDATVSSVNFVWSQLVNTNFTGVYFWGVDFAGATLAGDNLTRAGGCIYPRHAFGHMGGSFFCPEEPGEGKGGKL